MYVVSIDPGTRNFAMCVIEYDPPTDREHPETTEALLRRCTLRGWVHYDFGSSYIPIATARFATLMRTPLLAWAHTDTPETHVLIEQQGDPNSPMVKMCHALHGYFLCKYPRGNHRLDFPAARKFRGDFVDVQPQHDREPMLDPERERDPVKRAAILLAARLLSHMNIAEKALSGKRTVRSQQHLADALCQAVAYLHGEVGGSPENEHSISDPEQQVGTLLAAPRRGRKQATRTTTVRSARAKRTAKRKRAQGTT